MLIANALAYGDEVRFPLHIPTPLLFLPVPLAVVQLLLVSPDLLGCPACLSGVAAGAATGEAVLAGSNLLAVALVALLIWIVVTRWRQAPGVLRRLMADRYFDLPGPKSLDRLDFTPFEIKTILLEGAQ